MVIRNVANPLSNQSVYVLSKKSKHLMHEGNNSYSMYTARAKCTKCMLKINAQTNQNKTQQSDKQQSLV